MLWRGGFKLVWKRLSFAILLGAATTGFAQDAGLYAVDDVRLGRSGDRTRLVFDVSGPVQYRVVPSDDPRRMRLEFLNAGLSPGKKPTSLVQAPISSIEFSRGEGGLLSADLHFGMPVVYDVFTLKPYLDRGDRLVLDIYPEPVAAQMAPDPSRDEVIPVGRADDPVPGGASPTPQQEAPRAARPRSVSSSSPFRFGGTWQQEGAVETDGGHGQKFEALIQPRLDVDLAPGTDLTAIARIRLDAVGDLGPDQDKPRNYSEINGPLYNDRYAELSLRELYLDTRWGDTYWRLGKQQFVWGQADGIKVLDVVNPQSYREYILDDFDDSRIPLYSVKMEAPLGDSLTLQVLWIPDTTYHELAEDDTPYYITSPLLVPVAPPGLDVYVENAEVPDDYIGDSDIGARVSGFAGGWDVTLNYLYHYQDLPVFYQALELTPGGARGVVTPVYERSHMTGGTLSNAFGDFTLRAEMAYNTDTYHVSSDLASRGVERSSELASVLGLDWQLGQYDTLLSAQWFQSHLFDYDSSVKRDETEQYMSLFYQRSFAHDTWILDALSLYSLNHHDSLTQLKLKYLWQSNLELWGGADIFLGDRDGVFGQFRDQSRVLLGFELGF